MMFQMPWLKFTYTIISTPFTYHSRRNHIFLIKVVCVCVCVCAQSLQSGPTLCDPMDYSPPVSSVNRDSPGKNTGVGCHTLFQGILPTLLLSVACFWHNLVLVILYGSSRMGLCNHSWRGLINSWLKEWMNRDWTHMACIARQILNHWTTCEDPLKCHLHCELVL